MAHVVLVGDSIFDNASYVPGDPAVIDQLRDLLPAGDEATLLAVDGSVCSDVARQLKGLPGDATHLAVSIGGNDALQHGGILMEPARSMAEALDRLASLQEQFRAEYGQMMQALEETGLALVVCTIYRAIPGLDRRALAALSLFNDVIQEEAFGVNASLIDLRLICTEDRYYSLVSPIEPSSAGGSKIAEAIRDLVTGRSGQRRRSVVVS